MSGHLIIRRTKGGRTHYVASVIPKTEVIDRFTADPKQALRLKEDDAKRLFTAIGQDKTRYGVWQAVDVDDDRPVAEFLHPTPEPPKPRDSGPATVDLVGVVPKAPPTPAADHYLANEPDHSPFRELAAMFDGADPETTIDTGDMALTLGQVAKAAAGEIKALRQALDELTAPVDPPNGAA